MVNNKHWQNEIEYLKSILNTTQLSETTKWGTSVYTYKNKNIIGIGAFKSYFGVWFFNGAFLTDPHKSLINAQEGKTKNLRQIRYQSIVEINEKQLLDYINEAIQIEELGIKPIIPKSDKIIILPIEIIQLFETDKTLENCFNQLPFYKQKDYINYINEAKQEKTKINRIEKIKPMLLLGIGFNDKYKK